MDSIKDVIRGSTEVRGSCWVWQGSVDEEGYGVFECSGRFFQAHRSSAILFGKRVVLPRMKVYQTCGNKLCCNPEHLRVVDGRVDYDILGRENMVKNQWKRARGTPFFLSNDFRGL